MTDSPSTESLTEYERSLEEASYGFWGTFDEFMSTPTLNRLNAYVTIANAIRNEEPVSQRERKLLAWGVHFDNKVRNMLGRSEEDQWFQWDWVPFGGFHSGILPFGLGGSSDIRSDQAAEIAAAWAAEPEGMESMALILDPENLAAMLEEVGDEFTADYVRNPQIDPILGMIETNERIRGGLDIDDKGLLGDVLSGFWEGFGAYTAATMAGKGIGALLGRGTAPAAWSAARAANRSTATTTFGRLTNFFFREATPGQLAAWQTGLMHRYATRPIAGAVNRVRALPWWKPARNAVVAGTASGAAWLGYDSFQAWRSNASTTDTANAVAEVNHAAAVLSDAVTEGVSAMGMDMSTAVQTIERAFAPPAPTAQLPTSPAPSYSGEGVWAATPTEPVDPASPIEPGLAGVGGDLSPPPDATDLSEYQTDEITDPFLGGVGEGYYRTGDVKNLPPGEMAVQAAAGRWSHMQGTEIRRPQYRASDTQRLLAQMTPLEMESLIAKMQAAGLLGADAVKMLPQQFGVGVAAAFETLLANANWNATTWEAQLAAEQAQAEAQRQADADKARVPYGRFQYLPPDYDQLVAESRSTFLSQVGREPTDAELRLLADRLGGWDRQAAELAYDQGRTEYEQQQYDLARAEGTPLTTPTTRTVPREDPTTGGITPGGPTVTQTVDVPMPDPSGATVVGGGVTGPRQVNPSASLSEFIRNRYAGEIDMRARMDAEASNFALMMGSLGGITDLVRRGA